jgi:NAD(P)H-hydrate epimerase
MLGTLPGLSLLCRMRDGKGGLGASAKRVSIVLPSRQWENAVMSVAVLSREQVRSVDRLAIHEWGMSGLVLMENAGRGCVDRLCQLGIGGPVVICCGRGNNAGDGFVIARHLEIRGHSAKVLLWSEADRLTGDAAENYRILARTGVPIVTLTGEHNPSRLADLLTGCDWIVDALLGTGARGDPRPPLDAVIEQLSSAPAKRFAVDLPSGLDCDTGHASRHTFRADHTCTFVASKPGLETAEARPYIGQVHVLDIGVPRQIIDAVIGGS